jgi:DNA-binding response OmpR family regulator
MEGKKHRILVVDDEPDITTVFRRALVEAGFDVDVFNDSVDALAPSQTRMICCFWTSKCPR